MYKMYSRWNCNIKSGYHPLPLPLRAVEGGLATSNAVVRGVRIYGRVCSFAVVHIKGGLRQRVSPPKVQAGIVLPSSGR